MTEEMIKPVQSSTVTFVKTLEVIKKERNKVDGSANGAKPPPRKIRTSKIQLYRPPQLNQRGERSILFVVHLIV